MSQTSETLTIETTRIHVPINLMSALMLTITAILGFMCFFWPLFVAPGSFFDSQAATAPFVIALFIPVLLAMVLVQLTNGEMDIKALSMLGVLTAMGALARPLGAGTAGVETVFFLVIISGRVFGPGFGFILGNTTLFASALVTGGVGPWLPYQMVACGFFGLGAGLFPKRIKGVWELIVLSIYTSFGSFFYGAIMDFAFWPFAFPNPYNAGFDASISILENLHRFIFWELLTGSGWNSGRAITNIFLIAILGTPIMRILRRSSRQAQIEDKK